jgi:hypothetical protein
LGSSLAKSKSVVIAMLREGSTVFFHIEKLERFLLGNICYNNGVINILNWANGPCVLWESFIIVNIDFLMREKLMKHKLLC